jgi:hypothetical protein
MRRAAILMACLPIAAAVALSATEVTAQDAGAPALPACIQVGTSSHYVPYGYNHVVSLKNGCSKAATCTVATDVNPQPTSAEVAPGTTVEVLTFAGSPAQTFVARVTCKLH